MFCSACGHALQGLNHCPACGQKQVLAANPQSKSAPQAVRPHVVWTKTYLGCLPQWALLAFCLHHSLQIINPQRPLMASNFLTGMLLGMGLLPLMFIVMKKLRTRYKVYWLFDDHLEFHDNFIVNRQEAMNYKNIIEISMKIGLLGRLAGVGTLKLQSNQSAFYVKDVARPQWLFEYLKGKSHTT